MLLKNLCTTDVAVCTRDTTLAEVSRVLRSRHTGDVVIVDDPDGDCLPIGLVTDRDIVVKVLGAGHDPNQVKAGEIMRSPLVCADESEDCGVAVARMQAHGVRRLPITGARGRLVGIVTLDDLLRVTVEEMGALLAIVTKEQDVERRALR